MRVDRANTMRKSGLNTQAQMLIVLLSGGEHSGIKSTLSALLHQECEAWECVVLERSFVDEVEEAISFADDPRISVMPMHISTQDSLNTLIERSDVALMSILHAGDLPFSRYVGTFLEAYESARQSELQFAAPLPALFSCDVIEPRYHANILPGARCLREFIAHAPQGAAMCITVSVARGLGGFSEALDRSFQFEFGVRALAMGGTWTHIAEELVVLRPDSDAERLPQALYFAEREARLLTSLVTDHSSSCARRDLFPELISPAHAERVEAKCYLWRQIAQGRIRHPISILFRARIYFSTAGLLRALVIAILPVKYRRQFALRALNKLDEDSS